MVGATSFGMRVMPTPEGSSGRPTRLGSEAKSRQTTRISELGDALRASGLITVDEHARALGLSRSSTWALLNGSHKASGLAVATINRMLPSPGLPALARVTLLTYIEEKLAGLYGHNKTQLRRFATYLADLHELLVSANQPPLLGQRTACPCRSQPAPERGSIQSCWSSTSTLPSLAVRRTGPRAHQSDS
jgi:hypothetical protein